MQVNYKKSDTFKKFICRQDAISNIGFLFKGDFLSISSTSYIAIYIVINCCEAFAYREKGNVACI